MGEAVAAAATIVQLVGFGLSTAEKLISFAEKFSSHSQQIQRLATHVKRNARALAKLERSLTEDEKAGAHINDDFKEDIYSTVESCRDILVRLGDAIDISPSTAGDEKSRKRIPVGSALKKAKYALCDEARIEKFRNELSQCETTLQLMLVIHWRPRASHRAEVNDILASELSALKLSNVPAISKAVDDFLTGIAEVKTQQKSPCTDGQNCPPIDAHLSHSALKNNGERTAFKQSKSSSSFQGMTLDDEASSATIQNLIALPSIASDDHHGENCARGISSHNRSQDDIATTQTSESVSMLQTTDTSSTTAVASLKLERTMWIGTQDKTLDPPWKFNKMPITSRDIDNFVFKKAASLLDTLASLDVKTSLAVTKHVERLQGKLLAIHVRRKRSFGIKLKSAVSSMDLVTEKENSWEASASYWTQSSPEKIATNQFHIPTSANSNTNFGYSQQIPYCPTLPQLCTEVIPASEKGELPRPKRQCWDHGCNGREFSTFSNLLRHQRERSRSRSGPAPRSYCPRCGAEFTRSTARTNHLLNSKCKPRRSSNMVPSEQQMQGTDSTYTDVPVTASPLHVSAEKKPSTDIFAPHSQSSTTEDDGPTRKDVFMNASQEANLSSNHESVADIRDNSIKVSNNENWMMMGPPCSDISTSAPVAPASSWTLSRILAFLAEHGFSAEWRDAFGELGFCERLFLNLGLPSAKNQGESSLMHTAILPVLRESYRRKGKPFRHDEIEREAMRLQELVSDITEKKIGKDVEHARGTSTHRHSTFPTPSHESPQQSSLAQVMESTRPPTVAAAPFVSQPSHSWGIGVGIPAYEYFHAREENGVGKPLNSVPRNKEVVERSSYITELASAWTVGRVSSFLEEHGFSVEWQEAVQALQLCGEAFLSLGTRHRGKGPSLMYTSIHPKLVEVCNAKNVHWEQSQVRSEGKRLRKLVSDFVVGDRGEGGPTHKQVTDFYFSEPRKYISQMQTSPQYDTDLVAESSSSDSGWNQGNYPGFGALVSDSARRQRIPISLEETARARSLDTISERTARTPSLAKVHHENTMLSQGTRILSPRLQAEVHVCPTVSYNAGPPDGPGPEWGMLPPPPPIQRVQSPLSPSMQPPSRSNRQTTDIVHADKSTGNTPAGNVRGSTAGRDPTTPEVNRVEQEIPTTAKKRKRGEDMQSNVNASVNPAGAFHGCSVAQRRQDEFTNSRDGFDFDMGGSNDVRSGFNFDSSRQVCFDRRRRAVPLSLLRACKSCKRKKAKCDCARPSCTSCLNERIECEYIEDRIDEANAIRRKRSGDEPAEPTKDFVGEHNQQAPPPMSEARDQGTVLPEDLEKLAGTLAERLALRWNS